MATLSQADSKRKYSWWWDSHISPKNSKWLQENLTDMDAKVKQMIKLIEEDADSFARRAEMYYKQRPELMKLVEEFYRAYRALAERYDHATGALRQAHRTMAEAFPNQVPFVLADDSPAGSASVGSSNTWSVCGSGNILCSKVDGSEKYAIFGGKSVEMNMWDLDNCTKIWAAKSPPKNSLDIFTPTWFTSSTFLSKDDHRKIVAGTNSHQVRLYDISAQRRPIISFDFGETPIKSVTEDLDGYTVYVGNGSGDLASFDMRTGKLLGCFLGKCSGSIRSIARHPELPVIASCGLDSYLRLWDIKTRQLLSAVFLKQHLTNVVFDSNFADEEVKPSVAADLPLNAEQIANETEIVDEEEALPVKRKKASKEEERRKKKKATKENEGNKKTSKENNGSKKKASKENEGSKKLKSKKSKRSKCEIHDESCLCVQSKAPESNVDMHYD